MVKTVLIDNQWSFFTFLGSMKDPRYARVKTLIEGKHIKEFSHIVQDKNIPKSIVANDLGMRYETFERRLQDPGLFTLNEFLQLASWIDLPVQDVIALALAQKARKSSPRKKS